METLYNEYEEYKKNIENIKNTFSAMNRRMIRKAENAKICCITASILFFILLGLIYFTNISFILDYGVVFCIPSLLFCVFFYLRTRLCEEGIELIYEFNYTIKEIKEKTDVLADVLWKHSKPFASASVRNMVFTYTREDRTDMDRGIDVACITFSPTKGNDIPFLHSVYNLSADKKVVYTVPLTPQNRARLDKIQKETQKNCTVLKLFSNYPCVFPLMQYCIMQCSSAEDADMLADMFHNICMSIALNICEQKLCNFLEQWSDLTQSIDASEQSFEGALFDAAVEKKFEMLKHSLTSIHEKDILEYFIKEEQNTASLPEMFTQTEQVVKKINETQYITDFG